MPVLQCLNCDSLASYFDHTTNPASIKCSGCQAVLANVVPTQGEAQWTLMPGWDNVDEPTPVTPPPAAA